MNESDLLTRILVDVGEAANEAGVALCFSRRVLNNNELPDLSVYSEECLHGPPVTLLRQLAEFVIDRSG